MNKSRVIVILGPSGVGKTSICRRILEYRPDIRFSISATSRSKRRDEKNGREYIFLTGAEFKEWIQKGYFIEHAEVHGNLYGTPKKSLEENLKEGYHVLLDIDVKGAKNLKKIYPDGLYFFIVPPGKTELEERLLKRNTDEEVTIKKRLANAMEEFKHKDDYKYVVENRNLEEAVEKILLIIEKEIGS